MAPLGQPRSGIALVAVFAMLLQAILFGWHHHPLRLAARGTPAIASLAKAAVPLAPLSAQDGCEICAALHHLTATPGESAVVTPPGATASAVAPPLFAAGDRNLRQGFRARAPPMA